MIVDIQKQLPTKFWFQPLCGGGLPKLYIHRELIYLNIYSTANMEKTLWICCNLMCMCMYMWENRSLPSLPHTDLFPTSTWSLSHIYHQSNPDITFSHNPLPPPNLFRILQYACSHQRQHYLVDGLKEKDGNIMWSFPWIFTSTVTGRRVSGGRFSDKYLKILRENKLFCIGILFGGGGDYALWINLIKSPISNHQDKILHFDTIYKYIRH